MSLAVIALSYVYCVQYILTSLPLTMYVCLTAALSASTQGLCAQPVMRPVICAISCSTFHSLCRSRLTRSFTTSLTSTSFIS